MMTVKAERERRRTRRAREGRGSVRRRQLRRAEDHVVRQLFGDQGEICRMKAEIEWLVAWKWAGRKK